jgi:hypothetical protein
MKAIMLGAFLAIATATPGLAQAYCACWGTGNVIDQPLLEKTDGAAGYAMSVLPDSRAETPVNSGHHMKHNRRR